MIIELYYIWATLIILILILAYIKSYQWLKILCAVCIIMLAGFVNITDTTIPDGTNTTKIITTMTSNNITNSVINETSVTSRIILDNGQMNLISLVLLSLGIYIGIDAIYVMITKPKEAITKIEDDN